MAELESLAKQSADTQAGLEKVLVEATQREESALAEAKAAATVVASLRAGEGSGELLRASKSGRRAMVALAREEKQLGLSGSAEQASDWTWLTNRLGAPIRITSKYCARVRGCRQCMPLPMCGMDCVECVALKLPTGALSTTIGEKEEARAADISMSHTLLIG